MNDHDLSDLSGLETLVRTPDPDTATAPAALPGADRHGARPRAAGSRNAAPAGAAGAPGAPAASPAGSGASMAGSGGGRPAGRPRQHALDAGLVGLVAVGIAFLFGPLFTGYDYLGPLLAAPLLAAPAGWLLASRRLGFAAVALVGLLAGLVVTAVVLAPMPWPGRDGLGAVVSAAPGALRGGWAALMTATIPADATGPVLVVPALALWMATLLAAALAVRVRAPLAPVGPLLAGWGFALVTVAASGRGQLAVTGGVLLAAALLGTVRASRPSSPNTPGPTTAAAMTARPVGAGPVGAGPVGGWEAGARGGRHGGRLRGRRPGRGAGSLAVGLPAVALAVALGWAGAVLLPLADGADRYDPRAHTAAPLDSASLVNPLELVKPQLRAQPAVPLFTASFASSDGRLPVDRIRLVSLGTFDGASWRDDEVLRPAGHTLPGGADPGGSGGPAGGPGAGGGPATPVVRVRADITLASLEGPYLPSLGRPVSVSGLGGPAAPLVYGPMNGTLADTAPARRGLRYDLVTDVPDPGRDRLAHALPALGPAAAPYLSLPAGLPPALVQIAQRVTAGANSQYDKLTALADYLRDPAAFPYDLAARPGHSYGALRAFLTAANPAGRAGYSEQHAAAFALLARIEGFPTRLAVGYLLDRRDADGHGGFTVTTAQAHTWPEVELAGVGWVGFEPTDLSRLDGSPAPSGGPPPSGTSSSGASGVASDAIVVPDLAPRPAPRGGGAGWVVPAGVGAVLVLFGPLVVAEKARRRWRRRRARPPAAAVAGAYREVRDRLAEYGVSRSPALTPSDIAGRVRLLPGGGPVAGPVEALAPVVEAAVFGPGEPGRAEADAAWLSVALVRRELRRRTRWTRRLIIAVDPRVLLPARGARGARRSAAARGPRRSGSAVTGRL